MEKVRSIGELTMAVGTGDEIVDDFSPEEKKVWDDEGEDIDAEIQKEEGVIRKMAEDPVVWARFSDQIEALDEECSWTYKSPRDYRNTILGGGEEIIPWVAYRYGLSDEQKAEYET